jgi:hypothetical protein
MPLQAVIFIPASDLQRWAAICLDYCAARKYELAGIVLVDQGGWEAVVDMLHRGVAQIVVVARREHLPRGRVPRIEVTAEAGQDDPHLPATRRRTRRLGQAAR